jgi:O-antigen/teichoic acid export membrane protein
MLSRARTFLGRHHNVRAHFWQSMANYVQMGGGLLLGIVLARMLQPAVFGELVSISAFLAFMMIPLSVSAAQILVSDRGLTKGLFDRVMGMTWVISAAKLLALGAYIAWSLFSGEPRRATVATLVGVPLALADWLSVIRSDLEGRGLFKPNFYAQLSGLAAHGVVAVGLVYAGYGIYGLALGGFAAFLPNIICYLHYTDRRLGQGKIDTRMFREQFSLGLWLWLHHIASGWFSRIDKLFLVNYSGDTQLGYYNRAFNYGPISHLALNSLMTNATVRGLASKTEGLEKERLFYRTIAVVFCGGVINGVFWWLYAPAVVPFIFGAQWAEAVPAFTILGWLSLAYVLSEGAGTILLAEGQYRTIALVRITGLGILLFLLMNASWGGTLDTKTVSVIFLSATFIMGILMSYLALLRLHRCK